jgi:chorismatase
MSSATVLSCELTEEVPDLDAGVLGVVSYANRAAAPDLRSDSPSMSIAMVADKGFAEVWRSSGEVVAGRYGDLVYATDGEFLFCCGQTGAAADYLGPTERAYLDAMELMRKLDYSRLVRMWNMVEGINEPAAAGGCRYRRFCQGRGAAFEQWGIGSARMPAATGIGSHGGGVSFYFLAARTAELTHLENPRQTPAYRYPRRYGLTPPSFARATYLPGAPGRLFISGTASILGSDTVHVGDAVAQTVTTLENITALVAGENLARHGIDGHLSLRDLDQVKVYVKPGVDAAALRELCDEAFGDDVKLGFADVDICRADLLVEIEGVARVPAR